MIRKLPSGVFFGVTARRRDLGGLVFAESVYENVSHIPKHEHANAFLNLVLDGAYSEDVSGNTRTRGPNTLALHPRGEVHADRWQSGRGRVFHVEVTPDRFDQIAAYSGVLDAPIEFHGGPAVVLAMRLYREHLCNDAVAPLAIEGLTLELLAECSRRQPAIREKKAPRWLGRVRDLLESRVAESLSQEAIAAVAGVHPVHLARVFRRHFGMTVGEYTRGLRVTDAARQLSNTERPLAEIALAAGFADQSHFTRVFKTRMGVTPAIYRNGCRALNPFQPAHGPFNTGRSGRD